ncbi:MAG: hypothetical protein AABN34_04045 [Acidobacteriota bacterium]
MKSKVGFGLLFLFGFVLGLVLMANDARAQQPATDKDKAQQPATDKNKAQQPATDKNKAQQPATDKDKAQQPATDKDKAQQPATDKDKAQQPATDKVKAGQPAASAQNGVEGPYTINSSIEFGVRGIAINGNADKYRSDLNYTPGFRIFDSSLFMRSKDNNGPVFDTLMMSSFGWGNDPNKSLRVSAEKTKVYRFDANYRRFDYFNSLRNIALGQHTSNTEYRQGDFNLTILPQNEKVRFNLGYSLDRNSGPSVSTIRFNGDEYPVANPVRMAADEYRVGIDAKVSVFDLSFLQGWRFFKEDNEYLVTVPNAGNNLTNTAKITDFYRNAPTRGNTPFTRFSLHTLIKKKLDFTGRYIYTSGSTNYTFFQNGTGVDSSGNKVTSDIIQVQGNAKRPNGMGDLAATFYVTDRFRISETFRVNNFRINGGDLLAEALRRSKPTASGDTVLPPVLTNTLSFRTIDYRRYMNTIEADCDVSRWLSIHAGYRYTDRHIEIGSSDIAVGTPANPALEQLDNSTNTFILGLKMKPLKIWSVYFDLERGAADNVFTRVDNYNFTNVRVRSILRPNKTLSFNASLVTKDNNNPSIAEDNRNFGVNVKSRVFTSSADWSPNEKFSLNGGYTRANVTSDAQIIFFLTGSLKTFGESRYFQRDNFVFVSGFVQLHPRAQLFAGSHLHKDPGQGDRLSTTSVLIGSFPYEFQSSEAKFVVKLNKNVEWIAGYQYFDYKEQFINRQFYHAHLPYTSLRINFGRE